MCSYDLEPVEPEESTGRWPARVGVLNCDPRPSIPLGRLGH